MNPKRKELLNESLSDDAILTGLFKKTPFALGFANGIEGEPGVQWLLHIRLHFSISGLKPRYQQMRGFIISAKG